MKSQRTNVFRAKSTGTPGPVMVETVTALSYRLMELDSLALEISSSAAP